VVDVETHLELRGSSFDWRGRALVCGFEAGRRNEVEVVVMTVVVMVVVGCCCWWGFVS
jgi:hypothetical protein